METKDWAWLSGLFEGEGCISFTGKNSVALTLNSTDKDIIEKCRSLTGVGYMYGPVAKDNRCKEQWSWRVAQSADVVNLLTGFEPYFGQRRLTKSKAARQRLANVRKQGFCKRGHELEGDNLYVSPKGQRFCRSCMKIREHKRIKT